MQGEIRRIQRSLGITTISVTHDQHEAITMSDRIAVMREGRIEQVGTPSDIYERPGTRFVAQFMGASNFIRGIPGHGSADARCVEVQTAAGAVLIERRAGLIEQGPIDIVVRPERLRLGRADHRLFNGWKATIASIAYTGEAWRVGLILASGEALTASHTNGGGTGWQIGQAVNVNFDARAAWAVPPGA
jgi:ABC-type Fe3+/spermidine/putrescine transport system ATPase subunit